MPGDWWWVREMLFSAVLMDAAALYHSSPTVTHAENWLALGAGGLVLLAGASRRSIAGACLALVSAPLQYRGSTGLAVEDAPAMYRTFRDKDDARIKVIMKPGASSVGQTHSAAHE